RRFVGEEPGGENVVHFRLGHGLQRSNGDGANFLAVVGNVTEDGGERGRISRVGNGPKNRGQRRRARSDFQMFDEVLSDGSRILRTAKSMVAGCSRNMADKATNDF